MKTIKNLSVKVTYSVQLTDVEVSDEIYQQLYDNSEIYCDDIGCGEAIDWLKNNIEEGESTDWCYEIDDID